MEKISRETALVNVPCQESGTAHAKKRDDGLQARKVIIFTRDNKADMTRILS